jgi:hypothetical protein
LCSLELQLRIRSRLRYGTDSFNFPSFEFVYVGDGVMKIFRRR